MSRYRGSFPSSLVPNVDNDTLASKIRNPVVRCEDWIIIANFYRKKYFGDIPGREKYSFPKQHYKQMMP